MTRLLNETGHRYGRLIVVCRASNVGPRVMWRCRCDCTKEVVVHGTELRRGSVRSCGCLLVEQLIAMNGKHGHARKGRQSSTYKSWTSMIGRCTNPSAPNYPAYGGRGITVCERWLGADGFAKFLADMGERPPDPDGWVSRKRYWSLDRIDPDGNYEPSNCRWATPLEQRRNRRDS